MTKTYVVSGRGAKSEQALWTVPANVEIHFYFPCMRRPQFYKTRSVLEEVILAAGMFPDRVAVGGDLVPAHFVWAHPGEQPASGVFRRQSGNLAIDLAGATAQRPVALDHIVGELAANRSRRTTALHWIVRDQDWAAGTPLPDCMFPRRLRSASADDREESDRVPLVDFLTPRPPIRAGAARPMARPAP